MPPLLISSTRDIDVALLSLGGSGVSSNNVSPPQALSSGSVATASSHTSTFSVYLNDERVHLLNVYRTGVATWMDIFDHNCTYQRQITARALSSELLLRSVCAFTAHHLSLLPSGHVWRPIASGYYGDALALLIRGVRHPEAHGDALTAAILLGSYEVLSAQTHEHQHHGEGARNLIRLRGINASSSGLDHANFWIYVRHELSIALSNETSIHLDPGCWNVTWPGAGAAEDRMANYLLWLAAKTINVVYAADGVGTDGRADLTQSLASWYEATTPTFRGISYGPIDDAGLHKVHFAHPTAGE